MQIVEFGLQCPLLLLEVAQGAIGFADGMLGFAQRIDGLVLGALGRGQILLQLMNTPAQIFQVIGRACQGSAAT
jgi:L-asparaginase/Glu-tRNA(Gln) amidotransferase subunit D